MLQFERKGKQVRAHRLVAKQFVINHKPNKYNVVNHIDGNKQNNYFENLEWCTHSMNIQHAQNNGLNSRIKKIIHFDKNFNIIKIYNHSGEAANDLKKNRSFILAVCKKRTNMYDKNKKQIYLKFLEKSDDLENNKVGLDKLPIKPKKKIKKNPQRRILMFMMKEDY